MNKDELIKTIISNHWEYDVVLYLMAYINDTNKILKADCTEYKARLSVVGKLAKKIENNDLNSLLTILSEVQQ